VTFWSFFAPFWHPVGANWAHFATKGSPSPLQDTPKKCKIRVLRALALFEGSGAPFLQDFGSFLDDFWMSFVFCFTCFLKDLPHIF